MENKIFKLGLSVEAVSLYLILYDLEFSKIPLEKKNIFPRWNAPEEHLDQALEELMMHKVVDQRGGEFIVNPEGQWVESRSS